MSSKYIVRQPIKDAAGGIVGYEILYHGENQAFSGVAGGVGEGNVSGEFAAADTIFHFLTQNSTKVLKESLTFMTFTTMLLMKKTPKLFNKSKLVIQIDDSVIIHPLSMHFVQQYANEGYQIAVNEFQFSPRYLGLMDNIHYIKVNIKTTTDTNLKNIIEIARSMNKHCIVTNIESKEEYDRAVAMEADAYEGTYVAERMTQKTHSGGYLQSNFFRLMVAVSKDDPDVDEIEQIISADASLTYSLMKIANSAYYALRTRATTVKQCIMTMGIGQMKQWIYLLNASNADNTMDEGSEEFLKLSFQRANFCSELSNHVKKLPISRMECYMMGMFSTLDHLIDAPMEEILAEIPLADEVREALLHKTGVCGKLYDLMLSYEAANWPKITALASELNIPDNLLTSIYFLCVENADVLWAQLTNAYEDL